MLGIRNEQKNRRAVISVLYSLGICNNWIRANLPVSFLTLRNDLAKLGLSEKKTKVKNDVYRNVLIEYFRFNNRNKAVLVGKDVDEKIESLLAIWLVFDCLIAQFETINRLAKLLSKPEIFPSELGRMNFVLEIFDYKSNFVSVGKFFQELLRAYQFLDFDSLPTNTAQVKNDLLEILASHYRRHIGLIWRDPVFIKRIFDQLMLDVKPREKFVINHHHGIDCEQITFDQIAKGLNCTRQGARQLEDRALKKLRRPSRLKKFSALFQLKANLRPDIFSIHFYEKIAVERLELLRQIYELTRELMIANKALNNSTKPKDFSLVVVGQTGQERREKVLNSKLTDFELSVRAINCLTKANIYFVRQLVDLGQRELGKIRSCGRKTVVELTKFLQSHDIAFDEKNSIK